MSKNNNKNIFQRDLDAKEILLVFVVIGAIGVYGYKFIYPSYSQYQEAKNTLEEINSKITDYTVEINTLPKKREQLKSLEKDRNTKSKIIAHKMDDGMFLIGLSDVMDSVGVELVDYKVDESIEYDTFQAIPTTLRVRGNYQFIREVMYYLEEQKNMTQILDYTMTTYIPPQDEEENQTSSIVRVPDSQVYWTESGNSYHKISCEEIINSNGEYSTGTAPQSNKSEPCVTCKPYTEVKLEQSETSQDKEPPKSTGLIEAEFKFIMYSSQNPELELGNGDPSTWKPGKHNPFITTTR